MDAINSGLGGASFGYDDSRNVLRSSLMRNIYQFSAAKSLVELEQFRSMMLDSEGAVKPFYKFRQSIVATGKRFNDTYLRTEYDTAKQSAIMAHRWQSLQAEYLEYNTVGDEYVRGAHKVLDGKTYPKDHSFWDNAMPPLGWNCRCTVIPGLARNFSGDYKDRQADEHTVKGIVKDTMFDNNVGKSEVIYKDSHPFFRDSRGKEKILTWKQYGLRSEEKIRQSPYTPALQPSTKEKFYDKWAGMPKHAGDDIVLTDPLGQKILLDSGKDNRGRQHAFFKDHLFKKEDRSAIASEFDTVVTNPDEIWDDGKATHYLKFYKENTVKITVNNGTLKAESMYELTKARTMAARTGILKFSK
jgi:SPP1 gp7 family putative phage head morphogenesis protein